MDRYESWGRYPKSAGAQVVPLYWPSQVPVLNRLSGPVLAYGKGRSYGDCCLNGGGILLHTKGFDRFHKFDANSGILRCDSGVSLEAISGLTVPSGWFLPVTPGTQFVTIGGAVANDVHGKNHHRAGSFGCHVTCFEVLRSDGQTIFCSREKNPDLFAATIGGLGLTGLILWVELQLQQVKGPFIDYEQIRFRRLEEFFDLSAASDEEHEYTVAWLDCVATGKKIGRGLFMRGNPSERVAESSRTRSGSSSMRGFDAPEILINRITSRAFNSLYFHRQLHERAKYNVHFKDFFYPLDRVPEWNRLYGRRGFLQYQFVVPRDKGSIVQEILQTIEKSRLVCTLAVLKIFGHRRSPGLLSFPRPGITLALDFPNEGNKTLDALNLFDELVVAADGAVYPAKDARMSPANFRSFFPKWKDFLAFRDPSFSSDLWRRVTGSD